MTLFCSLVDNLEWEVGVNVISLLSTADVVTSGQCHTHPWLQHLCYKKESTGNEKCWEEDSSFIGEEDLLLFYLTSLSLSLSFWCPSLVSGPYHHYEEKWTEAKVREEPVRAAWRSEEEDLFFPCVVTRMSCLESYESFFLHSRAQTHFQPFSSVLIFGCSFSYSREAIVVCCWFVA